LDLNTGILKVRTGEGTTGTTWSDIAELVQVSPGLTLQDWFDAASVSLAERLVSTEELAAALGEFFEADTAGNILSFTMASPSGSKYRVTIDDSGNFVKTPLS
jgi:hypothetical protein